MDKSGGPPLIKRKIDSITDVVQDYLNEIKKGIDNLPDNVRSDYKKRKLLQEITLKSFILSKGPQFSTSIKKLETDLTSEMLLTGSWKELQFKPYNFDALGKSFYLIKKKVSSYVNINLPFYLRINNKNI